MERAARVVMAYQLAYILLDLSRAHSTLLTGYVTSRVVALILALALDNGLLTVLSSTIFFLF